MSFESVQLIQFRNLKKVELHLEEGVNVFYGKNAQGKTNFLEGLYFLSHGKSFRTTKFFHCIYEGLNEKDQENTSILKSTFRDKCIVKNLFKVELKKNKRTFWLNGKRTLSTGLSSICPTVLFSPESLSFIKEGPSERRALVDDFIEQLPEFSKGVTSYRKVLKSRNVLLLDVKKGLKKKKEAQKTLFVLNDIFLKYALDLIELRFYFLEKLSPYIRESIQHLFGKESEFEFAYEISGQANPLFNADKISKNMREKLEDISEVEWMTGCSLLGPHRHEIQLIFNGKDSRYYCSQGQQRALILAFRIAEVLYRIHEREENPILLLDDVMSELDVKRRLKLVDFLKGIKSQIIITTTESSQSIKESVGAHRQFKIRQGQIVSI